MRPSSTRAGSCRCRAASSTSPAITASSSRIEDGIRVGGIGTRIRQDLRAAGVDTAVDELGLPDEFLDHASRDEILEQVGLTPQAIARDIVAQVLGRRIPVARPLPGEDAADLDDSRLAEGTGTADHEQDERRR